MECLLPYEFLRNRLRGKDFTLTEIRAGIGKSDIQQALSVHFKNIGVGPKEKYGLVHSELAPPHIFILDNGEIGLVDFEGLKYFDKEFDWAVLEMMYDGKIKLPDDINKERLEFYILCWRIGYISASSDYMKNIDNTNEVFHDIYNYNLDYVKNLIKA